MFMSQFSYMYIKMLANISDSHILVVGLSLNPASRVLLEGTTEPNDKVAPNFKLSECYPRYVLIKHF
jgi:hypothetical protein